MDNIVKIMPNLVNIMRLYLVTSGFMINSSNVRIKLHQTLTCLSVELLLRAYDGVFLLYSFLIASVVCSSSLQLAHRSCILLVVPVGRSSFLPPDRRLWSLFVVATPRLKQAHCLQPVSLPIAPSLKLSKPKLYVSLSFSLFANTNFQPSTYCYGRLLSS